MIYISLSSTKPNENNSTKGQTDNPQRNNYAQADQSDSNYVCIKAQDKN
jgi:hypothetical protein